MDLLVLYGVMNEGTINVLGMVAHYGIRYSSVNP